MLTSRRVDRTLLRLIAALASVLGCDECEPPSTPPDPAAVASSIDPTITTSVPDSTAFLYACKGPQQGVEKNAIDRLRVSVLRGVVTTREGAPLEGVTVSIVDHAEYGRTATRADGAFDLAINAGSVTVRFSKIGYRPADRPIQAATHRYHRVDDVALVPIDSNVTMVRAMDPTNVQVVRGTPSFDASGMRQATLLVPPSTSAMMMMAESGARPLSTFHVRATELTVGDGGPRAMPAPLPPESGYTYAVDLTVDEAEDAGAAGVQFNQPLPFYVENFLRLPAGTSVPAGYYDRNLRRWVASESGVVLAVLAGGIDSDGDSAPDDSARLEVLGITMAERQQLAMLYPPGQTLWRVRLSHFSPWDLNFGQTPPNDAQTPDENLGTSGGITSDDFEQLCELIGSVIDVQSRVLKERLELVGTPYRLSYSSDRVPGRRAAYTVGIPLTAGTVPASLRRVDVELSVAGQLRRMAFDPLAGQRADFTWDGNDVYGRKLQGSQVLNVRIGYAYQGVYEQTSRFGVNGNGVAITGDPARNEVVLWSSKEGTIGPWNARAIGLGGWTIDVHHIYDPNAQVLHLGDGRRRSGATAGGKISGVSGYPTSTEGLGDGGPALRADIQPNRIAFGPDGSLYLTGQYRLRKIGTDGIIRTIAGTGKEGSSGDGGPADKAQISAVGVSVAPDGTIYLTEPENYRVRRIDTKGVITAFAGTGENGFGGDGGPAVAAKMEHPLGVAAAPDGNVYLADPYSYRVRRVSPDGIIETVAGHGLNIFDMDIREGGPATRAHVSPDEVAMAPDGSFYLTEHFHNRVRHVGLDGIIRTVVGLKGRGFSGDGGPATLAQLDAPEQITVARDGTLYIADLLNRRIRAVLPNGTMTTVAGNGGVGQDGDGGAALDATLQGPSGVAVAPDGGLHIADPYGRRIRRITTSMPGWTLQENVIPSDDGNELYVFSGSGRHLRTLNALTGIVVLRFSYDERGRLSAVTDRYGNQTKIAHGANGDVTITSPYGQVTRLALDEDGYLASATDPAGQATRLTYYRGDAEGLMKTMTDPRMNVHQFEFDELGRLTKDVDPGNGFSALASVDSGSTRAVTVTTALGHVTRFETRTVAGVGETSTNVHPSGLRTIGTSDASGLSTITHADGTVTQIARGSDPRLGAQAVLDRSTTISLPSGLSLTASATSKGVTDPNDPQKLVSEDQVFTVDGKAYASHYDAASRRLMLTKPSGRGTTVSLDANARPKSLEIPGLAATQIERDERGRLRSLGQGNRLRRYSYDDRGRLSKVTDPLERSVLLAYDAANRLTTRTLPNGSMVVYSYDANGNLSSVTPPGRMSHAIGYSPLDQVTSYSAPDAGMGAAMTRYDYDLEHRIKTITRPDGQVVSFDYDEAGRIVRQTQPRGAITFGYDPVTGNPSAITTPDVTITHGFDGTLLTDIAWSGKITASIHRTFGAGFRLASELIGGASVAFSYDDDGLLTGAGALAITRDPRHGLLKNTTLGGVSDERTYDEFGALRSYAVSGGGTERYRISYEHDALGRLSQKTENIDGDSHVYVYSYDVLGRLKEVSRDGANVARYEFDASGNRIKETRGAVTVVPTYDAQDRLTQYGNKTYGYTSAGDLSTIGEGASTIAYTYDLLGNLVSVRLASGDTVDYLVDGQNRRIGKKVNGSLKQAFIYAGQLAIVAELDDANNVLSRFIYAEHANVPSYMVKRGVTYRILSDRLGSPRVVVDVATGAVAQRLDYDEFGNVTDSNPGFQPFGFAGGLYDPDTKLVRFGTRDYDSSTGRWTTRDPLAFGGGTTDLYNYADGDPINFVDPSGLAHLEYDRAGNVLVLYTDDGQQVGLFSASNRSTPLPGADPWTPGGHGPIPDGSFAVNPVCNLGSTGQFQSGSLDIILPPTAQGQRDGIKVHGDAETNPKCVANAARPNGRPLWMCGTQGCIRVDSSAIPYLCWYSIFVEEIRWIYVY